ncbi:MAG: IclR family transcriptional regulator [Lautropia sp.]
MKSLDRMLALLDAFTPESPVWSTDALIRQSGTSASTCYRYLRSLHGAGLLARVANGSYILGPRVLEMDRITRLCDPVYLVGGPVIEQLSSRTGHSVILCILYSNTVMCVREALAAGSPPELFSRGQRRPLFRGASAKAILAWLPAHQLRTLFGKHADTIARAGLGADWVTFRQSLRQIREAGYAVSSGEANPGIAAIAAPIFNRDGDVLGSLSLAIAIGNVDAHFVDLAGPVVAAAADVTRRIGDTLQLLGFPARAVG